MNLRLKIFLFVIYVLVFLFLALKLRSRRAEIKYILPWLVLDIVLAVITVFPGILVFFCALFGIETPSNMLFFFALILLSAVVFSLTLALSRQNARIRELTQRLALWKERARGTDPAEDGPEGREG
jgi:hypothetical protein